MTLDEGSKELAALRAEFLDLMASMPEGPAESLAIAQRMDEIRSRIAGLSSSERPAPGVGRVDRSSVEDEIASVSSEIAGIRARIERALAASDFEEAGKLSMEASLLERRRRSLGEILGDIPADANHPTDNDKYKPSGFKTESDGYE